MLKNLMLLVIALGLSNVAYASDHSKKDAKANSEAEMKDAKEGEMKASEEDKKEEAAK